MLFLVPILLGSLSRALVSCLPLIQHEQKSMCLDSYFDLQLHSNSDHHHHSWVACPEQKTDMNTAYLRSPSTTTTSASFDIMFQCLDVSDITCQKAKRAFENAGKMISDVILFKEPIRVNATLMSFCKVNGECDRGMMTLGGSSPARAIPLLNDDSLMRLHPQALVKQFELSDHPAFAPFDILSVFNADAPYWFEEDNVPIQPDQADFTFVVLHEFMHGLGFYSGWNQYITPNALMPDPSPFLANQLISMINPMSTALHKFQFLESAMDRIMSIVSQQQKDVPVSDITKQLNKIQVNTIDQLVTSANFKPAMDMAFFATYPNSLGLKPGNALNDTVLLETGLKPFQPGSSISHVDYKTYTMTPDFLMRFMQDRGMTLQDAIKRGGGKGPIGPLLLSVLEELGYATVNKPNNVPHLSVFRQEATTQNHKQHYRKEEAIVNSSMSLTSNNTLFCLCTLLALILIN